MMMTIRRPTNAHSAALQIYLIINMSNEQICTNTILSNAKFRYVSLKRV